MLAKQKELGIVPEDTELPPINPLGTRDPRRAERAAVPALDETTRWDA